jgi:phospholipase/carboxylesterase
MNRIQPISPERPAEPAQPAAVASAARYASGTERGGWSVFAPLHYEPNYAYPLLVWLHGPDDDEGQLKRIMPLVSLRNYVAIAPRGTRQVRAAAPDGRMRAAFAWPQSACDITLAGERVLEAVAAAERRYNVRSDRVFLAGFDCGGTMAYRVATRHPERFAGVLSLGGAFPAGQSPLNRLAETRRLPLFIATGRDSGKYPPEQVCADLRLFHAAGMQVCLRQYPCGQELTTQMLADMDRWIMEQIGGMG